MLADALEGERLIGMAVLKPGWEEKYAGNPDIYPSACLGTILKNEPMPDGRSNILLLGLKRVRIKEILKPLPYRTACVEILEDSQEGLNPEENPAILKKLLELYGEIVIEFAGGKQNFPTLSNTGLGLAEMTDALAASLGLPIDQQVEFLGETNVAQRCQRLKVKMEALLRKRGPLLATPSIDLNLPGIYLN